MGRFSECLNGPFSLLKITWLRKGAWKGSWVSWIEPLSCESRSGAVLQIANCIAIQLQFSRFKCGSDANKKLRVADFAQFEWIAGPRWKQFFFSASRGKKSLKWVLGASRPKSPKQSRRRVKVDYCSTSLTIFDSVLDFLRDRERGRQRERASVESKWLQVF